MTTRHMPWAAALFGAVLTVGAASPASAQGALSAAASFEAPRLAGELTEVQYRGRYYRPGRAYYGRPYYGRRYYGGRRYDPGAAAAAGVIGGLALGALAAGALAQPAPAPAPVYGGELAIGSPAWYEYCTRRYRSFDPASGTFMGYDGVRRPCT